MQRTLSLRVYPTRRQESELREWLFLGSLLHNACIEERSIRYRSHGLNTKAYDQIRELPALKLADPRFAKPLANALQQVVLRVEKSFKNFFAKRSSYPHFTRTRFYRSLCLPKHGEDFKVADRRIWIGKLGWMKARGQRSDWIQSWTPKSSVIEVKPAGKWFLHVQCELPDQNPAPHTGSAIGIDVGLTNLVALSDGTIVENPRHLQRRAERLAFLQRRLARKQRGSRNRRKATLIVARQHAKVADARKDFHHKLSRSIVEKHVVIVVESGLEGLRRGRHAKGVHDAAWAQLTNFIAFKAAEVGGQLVKVNARGTSQECSGCGKLVPKGLAVRVHNCDTCGLVLDRDVNAARNILKRGLAAIRGELPQRMGEVTPVEMGSHKPAPASAGGWLVPIREAGKLAAGT